MSRRVDHDGKHTLQIRFPFDRNLVDRIKGLPSRRWNAGEKFWFVPEDDVLLLVDLLADDGFQFDEATRSLYAALGGSRDLSAGAPAPGREPPGLLPLFADSEPDRDLETASAETTDLSVGMLNDLVKGLLAGAFPAPVWLVGEVSGFNKSAHRKHIGFELIDRDPDGRAISKVSAILFDSTRRDIERDLRRSGDPFALEDEITVRLQVRVDLYVPWGQYRVVIESLDVNYTLGEAARRREEIVRKLTAEGLHEVNRSLPLPELPLRLGLITSLGSDAYNDVMRTLGESRYAFDVTVHGARVQGLSTEPSVLNALDWFAERADRFDAILICRGGGSRTDLVWFDTERLGRAVALFPLPVVVGIGHEQDQSVLDFVARSCKTPTAAASRIVECVDLALARSEEAGASILDRADTLIENQRRESTQRAGRLAGAARHRLELARERIGQIERQARGSARSTLQAAGERLRVWSRRIPREALRRLDSRRAELNAALRSVMRAAGQRTASDRELLIRVGQTLGPAARRALEHESERLDQRRRRLSLLDPRRVVERGYAILRREDDSVLIDAARVQRGESLVAELKHGRLRVTADKMVPDSKPE